MLKQVLEIVDLVDGMVTGNQVAEYLYASGANDITVFPVEGELGHTDFIRIFIKGKDGKKSGGSTPTLGVIGRLGGVGARPERIGMVSDADGAIVALSVALKLLRMQQREDWLDGDVIITTHVCPNAPTLFHQPVPFMNSPVDMATLNTHEVIPEMDAILSVDATKGNYIVNCRGIAISPTVLNGYILPISPRLLDLAAYVTGRLPVVLPLSQYDITPYGNDLNHINSIMQPAVATESPVVGVAVTAQTTIPGSATGACQEIDLRDAGLFCVETAKCMKQGTDLFYSKIEYDQAIGIYGSMAHFKKPR
jgi:hypothetical protein